MSTGARKKMKLGPSIQKPSLLKKQQKDRDQKSDKGATYAAELQKEFYTKVIINQSMI